MNQNDKMTPILWNSTVTICLHDYTIAIYKNTQKVTDMWRSPLRRRVSITRQICSYAWMKNKNSLSIAIRHTKTIETASKVVHVIRTWFTQTNEKENLLRRERKSWSKLCHVNLTCHHILRPCKINPQPPKKTLWRTWNIVSILENSSKL